MPSTGRPVPGRVDDRLHHRGEPGDRAAAQVVAVGEAAGQHDGVHAVQVRVGVPERHRLGAGHARRRGPRPGRPGCRGRSPRRPASSRRPSYGGGPVRGTGVRRPTRVSTRDRARSEPPGAGSAGSVLESALAEVVGPEHVLTDPDLRGGGRGRLDRAVARGAAGRWSGRGRPPRWRRWSGAALRPGCRSCRRAATPGWSAGRCRSGCPARWCCRPAGWSDCPLWTRPARVVAGAGASLAVRAAGTPARPGWEFGLDFASRDSATVGGAVATNAGGLRVLRFGPARAQLVGVEAVLASGAVLSRVDGPVKDSTGYDLSGLLCGSEGTLGVLTRVRRAAGAAAAGRRVRWRWSGWTGSPRRWPCSPPSVPRLPGLAAAELIGSSALELLALPRAAAVAVAGLRAAGERRPGGAGPAGGGAVGRCRRRRRRAGRGRGGPGPAVAVPGGGDRSPSPTPGCRSSWTSRSRRRLAGGLRRAAGRRGRGGAAALVILFGHLAEANLHVNVLVVA